MNSIELQTLKEIKEQVGLVAKDLADMKLILGGDWRTGKEGLVQSQSRVMDEIYNEKRGLMKRLNLVELAKEKMTWTCGLIVALLTGAGWLIEILIRK